MANKISVLVDVTVDRANQALKGFQSSIKDADGAVGKFKAGTASIGNSLKANLIPVAAAAGVAVAAFAAKSIDAASDLEESTNAVNKSFGDAAEGVLAIGENAAESFGLSKAEFNEAAVAFSSFAKEVAGPGGDVSAVIEELTTRAADFASVMNISVAEASTVFRSGLSGETEPLKRFGINLSAAAVEAYALSEGLISNKKEMTEAIKVQARYGLLLEKTAMTAGDFADTSEGLANTTRIAQAKITDFQAEIGAKLIPTVAAAANVAMDLADALERVGLEGDVASGRIEDSGFFGNIESGIKGVLNPLPRLIDGLGEVTHQFDNLTGSGEDTEEQIYGTAQSMVDAEIKSALLERATKDLEAAEKDAEQAAEDRTEAIDRATAAINEARDATDALTESVMEAANSDLAYRNQVADTAATIAEATLVQADANRTAEEHAQAARDVEAAVYDQADAAVQLMVDQKAANGETATAEQKANTYRAELARLVADLDGPAADSIRRYIGELNAIPRSIYTNIQVTRSGDLGPMQTGNRASGGPVSPGGAYLVGEDGPELLQMGSQSGHVTNAAATSGLQGMSAADMSKAVSDGMVAGWKRVQQMGRAS